MTNNNAAMVFFNPRSPIEPHRKRCCIVAEATIRIDAIYWQGPVRRPLISVTMTIPICSVVISPSNRSPW